MPREVPDIADRCNPLGLSTAKQSVRQSIGELHQLWERMSGLATAFRVADPG